MQNAKSMCTVQPSAKRISLRPRRVLDTTNESWQVCSHLSRGILSSFLVPRDDAKHRNPKQPGMPLFLQFQSGEDRQFAIRTALSHVTHCLAIRNMLKFSKVPNFIIAGLRVRRCQTPPAR